HSTTYAGYDGGFLRLFVRAYYQACATASLSPSVASPSTPGASILFTASSTGCDNAQYRFFVQPPGGSWIAQTGYGGNAWTWNTTGFAPGVYGVGVWVRNSGSPLSYEAYWLGTFTLAVSRCTSATLGSATASPQAAGTSVTFNASATGCPNASYRFYLLRPGGSWTMQRDYGASSWTWSTAGLANGTYQVGVWARQQGSAASYDAFGFDTFVIGAGSCAVRMSGDVAPPLAPGTTVAFTATSTGCSSSPQYQFWLLPPGGSWTVKQAYGASGAWSWSTAGLAPGTYQVGVWARSAGS